MYLHALPGLVANGGERYRWMARLTGMYKNDYDQFSPMGYRKFFPIRPLRAETAFTSDGDPFSLYCPVACARARRLSPNAKVIISLREPVSRAYSHYKMHRSEFPPDAPGVPSFQDMVEAELSGEPLPFQYQFLHMSNYLPHVKRWVDAFGAENVLIMPFSEATRDMVEVAETLSSFLGIERFEPRQEDKNTFWFREPIDPALQGRLRLHFRDANAALFEYLGRDLGWNAKG